MSGLYFTEISDLLLYSECITAYANVNGKVHENCDSLYKISRYIKHIEYKIEYEFYILLHKIKEQALKLSKIEKVPRGIRGEKSSKDMASSRNLVSTIGAPASPKMGDGTRCPEG